MTNTFIEAHVNHLRAAGRSKMTIRSRRQLLYRVDHALPRGLVRATTSELEAFLGQDWEQWTRCTYHMHLRGFFTWATAGRDPYLDWDPTSELARPRKPHGIPKPVTDHELQLALGIGGRWPLVVTLAAWAGLRAGEIVRLRREDVTAERLTVLGKGGRVDAVPTHPRVWGVVGSMGPGHLLCRRDGSPGSSRWLTGAARWAFDRAGLPNVHLHRFRHWFGTMVQRSQGDLRVTQRLMRHASPATTAGYAAVVDEQLRAAVLMLPE